MNKTLSKLLIFSLFFCSWVNAQITERERPPEWEHLVYGGRFMDRFLPMPDLGGMTADVWGAESVVPRDANNGIEDDTWSYWGGNARLMDDGKYHLFVCRWEESAEKGHMEWPHSHVVHAVSENSYGPYEVIDELGKGHNPEWYITKSGKYVVYVINGYYLADDINGPWEYRTFEFQSRDRNIIEGLSNLTFTQREDGSMLMICRGGGVWVSEDGLSEWNQLTDSRVYPPVEGRFEDPLIWKTNVQYHLIVNDWLGRIAWYLRSKDGIHWKTDAGEAYEPGIANHADGTKEDWFKYERIKVLQDEYGRATQAHFAVIDTVKWEDLGNDNHSSKHITIPLTVGRLVSVVSPNVITPQTEQIVVKIEAEEGFNPHTDIDLNSLRFGAPEEVDFGRGSKAVSLKEDGKDALITFEGQGNGITEDNFAAKLLGKDNNGNLLFGYSRLPKIDYKEAFLSARKPILGSGGEIEIEVQNFGQVPSETTKLVLVCKHAGESIEIGSSEIPPLEPFEKITVPVFTKQTIPEDGHWVVVIGNEKNAFSIQEVANEEH